VTLATVCRWRGIAAGWQALGAARPLADAHRLAALAARISPDAHLRVSPVHP
jgi:hypothetical protein